MSHDAGEGAEMAVALRYGNVVDKYLMVVPGAASLADQYMDTVQASIEAQQLPVRLAQEKATSGLLGAVRGQKRTVLLVEPTSAALGDFSLFLFGVPNGVNLSVGWFLSEEGRGQKTVMSSLHPLAGAAAGMSDLLRNLNIFDVADLQSICTAVHEYAVMEAVYAVSDRVGLDRSRINKGSSGFLGIH
jgi:hypothetical protein